ncbi:MAG: hypothetical protein ABL907_24130 [Hyphomicrobium sp.]
MTLAKFMMLGMAAFVAAAGFAGDADAAKKRRLVRQAPAAGASVSGLWHDARVERGFICYTDHFHYGSSGNQPSRRAAEAAAINSWSSFVDLEYGGAWSRFAKAGSKRMTCTQGSGGWDCSVEARPCK